MRLTVYLCKQSPTYQWKQLWKRVGKFHEPELRLPRVLREKGIQPEDPGQEKTDFEPWTPPVEDGRFWKPPPESELPDYHEIPARQVTRTTRLTFGCQQAGILAKAQAFEGLPPSVLRLVDSVPLPDQDKLVQRSIMQSQLWNPTKDKLPRRIDKENIGWKFTREYGIPKRRAGKILVSSLLHLCQSTSASLPSLLQHRRLVASPFLDTHFYHEDKLVNILGHCDFMLASDVPLPAFADETEVDQSVNVELPSIEPSYPTLDLAQSHRYTVQNMGAMVEGMDHWLPHTLVMVERNYWKPEERLATAMLYCLGHAIATARRRFGEDVRNLPEPVCNQCVIMDDKQLNFVCFQLNTLSLSSRDGIKNMVWFDGGNTLFRKDLPKPWKGFDHREVSYHDYDKTIFPRLLALYLYGLPDVAAEVKESSASTMEQRRGSLVLQ